MVFSFSFNPYLTNVFSHFYHLGESTFIFRGIRSDFQFLNNFLMKILLANRIAPDGTPRFAASHLGLFCLPMSHKRDTRNELRSNLYLSIYLCILPYALADILGRVAHRLLVSDRKRRVIVQRFKSIKVKNINR